MSESKPPDVLLNQRATRHLQRDLKDPSTAHSSMARVWERRALIAELALRNILEVRLDHKLGDNAHNVARQQMRRIARDAFEEMDPW